MPTNLTLPTMGESITEATVSRWLKAVGEAVKADEPLVEVSTDKVDTEIPSPVTGVVTQILATEDQVVRVGDVLAIIEESASATVPAVAPTAVRQPASPPPAGTATAPSTPSGRPPLPWNRPVPSVPDWSPPTAPDPRPAPVATPSPAAPAPRPPESRPWMTGPPTTPHPASVSAGGRPGTWQKPWEKSPPPAFVRPPVVPAPPAPRPARPAAEPVRTPAPPPAPAPVPTPATPPPGSTAPDSPAYVTPLVRQVARELGVDLADLVGTGVGGRVRKQDVLDFATQHPELTKPRVAPNAALVAPEGANDARRGTTQTIPPARQAWLRHASESIRTTLPLTAMIEADVSRLVDTTTVSPSVTAFVLSATAHALRTCAAVNAGFEETTGAVAYHDGEHLGFTLETVDGPVSPVLHDAGQTPPTAIETWLHDVTARASSGDFAPDDLVGGTFTVVASPALVTSALVSPPQVAALGIGAPTLRPVVREGEIVPRTLVWLHLTYDTRVVDPSAATAFLATIKDILEG